MSADFIEAYTQFETRVERAVANDGNGYALLLSVVEIARCALINPPGGRYDPYQELFERGALHLDDGLSLAATACELGAFLVKKGVVVDLANFS